MGAGRRTPRGLSLSDRPFREMERGRCAACGNFAPLLPAFGVHRVPFPPVDVEFRTLPPHAGTRRGGVRTAYDPTRR